MSAHALTLMASTRVSWSVGPEELMVSMEDLRAALVDTGVATKADAHAAKAESDKKTNQHVGSEDQRPNG